MPVSRKIILLPVLIILISSASYLSLFAQEQASRDTFNLAKQGIHFPDYSKTSRFRLTAGLSMVKPPKDLLETAIQAPLGNFHVIYTTPWRFSLEGDLTTLIVSNQLSLGPSISFSRGPFGLKVGYDIGWVAGRLKQFGFDNSTRVWIHYPNVSLGYKMKDVAFTLEGETILVSSITTKTGENELTSSQNFFNGCTGALYIEQRLHKNKVFVIGIKDSYVKYYWPTWMVFSTFNRFYHIPELYFAWII